MLTVVPLLGGRSSATARSRASSAPAQRPSAPLIQSMQEVVRLSFRWRPKLELGLVPCQWRT
jgi:hypothetical protein